MLKKCLLCQCLLLPLLLVACKNQESHNNAAAPAPTAKPVVMNPAPDITPADVAQVKREHPDVVLLDVRTPEEFAGGHIPGAINMNVNSPDFDERVTTLDKSKQHVVYCRTGRRSTTAAQKLTAAEIPTLHLAGGITAWQKENLPTTRP